MIDKDLIITQQDLVDWIDRPPSNDDLDLCSYLSNAVKNQYEYHKEIERLNNIMDELEKWLNEYYESNRKWYNTELSNHDRKYYEREYRNTEFMIVKFKKQLNELKGDNK